MTAAKALAEPLRARLHRVSPDLVCQKQFSRDAKPCLPLNLRPEAAQKWVACVAATASALLATIPLGHAAEATTPVAPSDSVSQVSLEDAWWTGPLLASNAATLEKGHFLVEPYVYDTIRRGRFDNDGRHVDSERGSVLTSLTYLYYGLNDTVQIGIIPKFNFTAAGTMRPAGFALGDLSLQAQYLLTQFTPERKIPTVSVVVTETLPTGKYDRLANHYNNGFGSGAFGTTAAIFAQYYAWMPTGRILRTRLNLCYTWSTTVALEGVSVYGTSTGFHGNARPGTSASVIASAEYSLTRNWVLALDAHYEYDGHTRVWGIRSAPSQSALYWDKSGTAQYLEFAPAIEYNLNSNMGVIAGIQIISNGRNTQATITPQIAVNMAF